MNTIKRNTLREDLQFSVGKGKYEDCMQPMIPHNPTDLGQMWDNRVSRTVGPVIPGAHPSIRTYYWAATATERARFTRTKQQMIGWRRELSHPVAVITCRDGYYTQRLEETPHASNRSLMRTY